MRLLRWWLAASLAAVPFSSGETTAQTPRIGELDVKLDRAVDLSLYRTYAWSKDQVPVANLANHLRLINAVQDHMKAKGFRIDTVNPDVLIRYRVEQRSEVQARSTQEPSVWDPSNLKVEIDLKREETISLTITIVEAETRFPLWEAKGTYRLGTADRAERQINSAVEDLFAKYPEPDETSGSTEKK